MQTLARLGKAILTNVGLLLLLTLIIVSLYGIWTVAAFASSAFWSGALGILIAIFSMAGGWLSTRSVPYQYGASAGTDDIHARGRQARLDSARNESYLIRMGSAGIFMLLLSSILSIIVGSSDLHLR